MTRNQSNSKSITLSAATEALIEHAEELPRLFKFEDLYFVIKPASRRVLNYFDRAVISSTDDIEPPNGDPIIGGLYNPNVLPFRKDTPWKPTAAPKPLLIAAQDAILRSCLLYPEFAVLDACSNREVMAVLRACLKVSGGSSYEEHLHAVSADIDAQNTLTICSVYHVPPHVVESWTQDEFLRALASAQAILTAAAGIPDGMTQSGAKQRAEPGKFGNAEQMALDSVQPVDLAPRSIDFGKDAMLMGGV